ncbi:MAG: hypothetical protein HWD59_06940 [Coxiellaceae bacterium]|nr:MAG: hypothetical protein HWD59_06940 [Coxiellaceae bacterium]
MENVNFTAQQAKPQMNGYYSHSSANDQYQQSPEKEYEYDYNFPVSAIFDLLQKCPIGSPLHHENTPTSLLKTIDHCCEEALDSIHRSIASLGDVLAVAVENEDAGIDSGSISSMGYLFQMLGRMATDLLSFKSNAEYELQRRG